MRVPAVQSDENLAIDLFRMRRSSSILDTFMFSNDGYLVLSLITEPSVSREGIKRLLRMIGN